MNKPIGIIGAMDIEINELVNSMTDIKMTENGMVKYYEGFLLNRHVVVAKCGIGKVFASVCAQNMINFFSPQCIINTGVAGSLSDKLDVFDTVISEKVVQYDMDTSALGDPKGMISGINKIFIDSDENISKQLSEAASLLGIRGISGVIATGDRFVHSEEEKRLIANAFGATACEMEGGAIGQVCYINNVPFSVLRSISDGKGAQKDYQSFSVEAARNSVNIVKKFLEIY